MTKIEEDLKKLQNTIKSKFGELKNLYRENRCFYDFVKEEKLMEKYETWRLKYFQLRKWK